MGLEFGHRLGLPQALTAVPLSPLVGGYEDLVARQHALGLRHMGEALVDPGGRLRVLDGVYVSRAPRGWRRIDGAALRRSAADGPPAGELLLMLADLHDHDPTALRRVLLYQLIELLQSRPPDGRDAMALSLGVDPGEVAALVHAAGAQRRPDAAQRAAAEGLQDAWERRRLRHAARLASRLPPGGGPDPFLAERLRQIAALVGETDASLAAAHRLERQGDGEGAAGRYLQAARLAADSKRALRGLVRTHRPGGGAPGPLAVELLAAGPAQLTWADDGDITTWRVIRLDRSTDGRAPSVTEVRGRASGGSAQDPHPPLGAQVRYAVLPLRDGVVDGPPLVSAPLLVAPEVLGLRLADGRERVTAVWTTPAQAVAVRAVMTGPDGTEREIAAVDGGFTVHGLRTGPYRVRVSCRYRGTDGREVGSPGVEDTITVPTWPSPVLGLAATAGEGGVRFSWTGGEDAEVRLVEWPGGAPATGTELSLSSEDVPEPLPWPRAVPGVLVPPPGAVVRVTAVAVRGERAVAGPGVRIEVPHPVTALTAERIDGGLARVTFDWPADAGQVAVSVEQEGRRAEHRVARSVFLREGLHLPVGPSPARLTAQAVPRTTDATVVPPPAAAAQLPADVTIAYRVVPGSRRSLRRRPATVRISLSSPAGEPAGGLPEFVLVARPGTGSLPVRPRDPADGTTVLRLSGEELHRAGRVEREIATGACRPPYALRGFLLGGAAASVRLEEPSPATLVVR
ncbi:hypothetical protein [Streptomyces cinnamoneus]|uniref:LigA protein n=1 Tax=Streptomyces cinnamoneus TaxID=53446 RepID=A0A918WN06_STRCJ|nr:hypothetical protein [Streptomyces cinnamoneus]GHC58278.1 hypothetical protein GCM10010507_38880 [Streptomyces cinnamoneus]